MFKIEKRWGKFEFEITGTNYYGDAKEQFVVSNVAVNGQWYRINVPCPNMIPVNNFQMMVEELEKSLQNDNFCMFDLNDIRIYVIPSMHELDINTYDGFADLFESEYGDTKSVITIAVKLDRDDSYEEMYPENDFIPNAQVALEHDDSVEFVQYLKKSAESLLDSMAN